MEYKNNNNTQFESVDKYISTRDIIMELKEDDFKKKYGLNSIGTNKRTLDKKRKKTQKKKQMIANRVAASLLVITGFVIGVGVSNIAQTPQPLNDEPKITATQEQSAEDLLKEYVKLLLCENNLATLNTTTGKITLNNNSVEDYKKLNINAPTRDAISSNKEHLIIYGFQEVFKELQTQDKNIIQKNLFYGEEEFNKFIQSVTYGGPEYDDIVNFYRLGGYINEITNEASALVFDNYMEGYLKNHQDELIEEYTKLINDLNDKNSLYSQNNSINDNLIQLSTASRGGR